MFGYTEIVLKICHCRYLIDVLNLFCSGFVEFNKQYLFLGNSLSAILEGEARLTFLNRGEDYVMTMPYAHCKGKYLPSLCQRILNPSL
jgi:hypothetical protein